MVQYICDKQGEVRQAAAYGFGVMAQFGGQEYLQAYTGMPVCICVFSFLPKFVTIFLLLNKSALSCDFLVSQLCNFWRKYYVIINIF